MKILTVAKNNMETKNIQLKQRIDQLNQDKESLVKEKQLKILHIKEQDNEIEKYTMQLSDAKTQEEKTNTLLRQIEGFKK